MRGPGLTHDRQRSLEQASVPVLIMCLAQITGDSRWLEDPYLPKRDISIFADPSGGLDPVVQSAVREAMAQVLDELDSGQRVLPPLPDPSTLVKMMSVCLGEKVPPEYAEMAMEEMGYRERGLNWPQAAQAVAESFRVLVIGAGFSGIATGRELKRLGLNVDIVEKLQDLGGVWLENDYPEAGVDTPNHFYSFSFAPNLDWSSNYSKRAEVWAYQKQVFEQSGLAPHTEFGVEVVAMRWSEPDAVWFVTCRDQAGFENERRYHAVITASGNLNIPKLANIQGIDSFPGPAWHSARWRHDVDLRGKRAAVIGTGASAMQFLRTIAGEAAHVTIFQRSAQWARPPQDYHGTTTVESRWLLKHVPYYYAWYRFGLMWRFGDGLLPTVRRDPAWPHTDRAMNSRNDKQRIQLTEYLLGELAGRPDLIEKCLPDYPPYGKRILIDNGWYQTLRRDNVSLITEAVDSIAGSRIMTASGEAHEADVLIFATGFEPARMLASVDIRGRSGVPLAKVWANDDPRAFLGVTVPDYPNLFIISGPNTGLAHGGSVLFVTECQVRYIIAMLQTLAKRGASSLEVRRDVHDHYNQRVDAEHAELVWAHPGMTNWYRNASGRVFSPMPWRLVDYWHMTREVNEADFHFSSEA